MSSTRRSFLLISLLCFASACGCPASSNATELPPRTPSHTDSNWSDFEDPELGFSVQYPPEWFYFRGVSADESGGNFVLFSSALGNTSPQVRSEDEDARLIVNVLPNDSGLDVESWLAGSPLLRETVTRPTVNGIPGIRVLASDPGGDNPSEYVTLFLVTPEHRYSLVGVVAPSSNASQMKGWIIQMQDSFKPHD